MPLAGEQFGGTLGDALEMLTAQKAPVIEKELHESGLLRAKPQCSPLPGGSQFFTFSNAPKSEKVASSAQHQQG
jgi:hypothetical protein